MKQTLTAAIVAALIAAPAAVAVDRTVGLFSRVDVVNTDPAVSTLGVRGHEAALGTAKISHDPSAAGATDPNAAALSLWVNGDSSGATPAAQGIFFNAPQGTTGKLLNLRIAGQEVFVLKPDPLNPGRVVLQLRGRTETLP